MKTKLYFFLWVCLSTLLIACVDDDIEPDVVPVTGVSLNKTALALDEGESESLIATVIPDNATNKKVTWKSSDTSVATVNASGKVTAQATGTVVVVVITEDGAEVATCTVTCGDGAVEPEIPVTDVALNKSTLSLIEGQSESLQVIITPDDATNKKVAWVSNDESVAMVDVNGKVTALKAGSTTIVAVTEDGAMTASCKVTVEPAALLKGTRTILAYIAADNTLASFASLDLAEMKAGMAKVQDSNVHFLVYIDDGKSPRLLELKNEKGAVVETVVETYGSRNSVGVSETQEVFAKVFSNSKYQADSYGLVYWSHGDGWLPYPLRAGTRWVGQDKGNGDNRMNISEFVEILKSAPHFDFMLFDACYMQSVEVIYQLRDRTDYFIGSPTEIPGPGAPYEAVVPALFSQDKPEINIAESYYTVYAEKYNNGIGISNENWTGGVSVSVVKSSELPALATATKGVLQTAASMQQRANIDITGILCYDPLRSKNYHDLMGLMKKIQENQQAFDNYAHAYQNAVVWKNTTDNNYCTYPSGYGEMVSMNGFEGLSTYILRGNDVKQDAYYRQSVEWYSAAGWADVYW